MRYMVTNLTGMTAIVHVKEVGMGVWQAHRIDQVFGAKSLDSDDTPVGESPLIAVSKVLGGCGIVKIEQFS